MARINKAVPNANHYYPLNEPAIGTALDVQDEKMPELLKPLILKGVTFKNRMFASPMCQYSSDNGHATDWHLVHLGGFATRGVGAIIVEATAVVPEGRISPEDAGLWADTQIDPLKRIVDFSHAQTTPIGIQLSHAGRKSSTLAPWAHSKAGHGTPWLASKEEHGWPDEVYGPSTIPFAENYPQPKEMSHNDIKKVQDAFLQSVSRAEQAGFDFIELHFAHGYLVHTFLSPLSNQRSDEYGGSFENRIRIALEITKSVRDAWPSKPLFARISGSDWGEGDEKAGDEWKYWGIEQSKLLVGELIKLGVDFIDVSSGGNWHEARYPAQHGYQVPFAEAIKKAYPDIAVGTVGLITEPSEAEGYLKAGKADVVLLARELLRRPHFPLYAAKELGVRVKAANQYERAW